MSFQVGGLLFDSEIDYEQFKEIDRSIGKIVRTVENDKKYLDKFFDKIKTIKVKETYENAGQELENIFPNTTLLLCYEGTRFCTDYEVANRFFGKINVIVYESDEPDSELKSTSDLESETETEYDTETESESESD